MNIELCALRIPSNLERFLTFDRISPLMEYPLISAVDLGKTYRIYPRPWDRFRELVTGLRGHQEVAALRGVTFELDRGESLGIIGENGAGKSTLLKLLSGVTRPSRGQLVVRGKVASLLELGMGFHSDFTGRQNIRLNAAIMGITEEEVEEKATQIIEYSELGEFIDRPVKVYSSGMVMRLGFAIAIHVDPEILIIDEALSVGDGYFQKKCMDSIFRFVESGKTLLFCSHAMYYVSAYCKRALWLRGGEMQAFGPVEAVVREYENHLLSRRGEETARSAEENRDDEKPPSALAQIRNVRQLESAGALHHGDPWSLEIEWETVDSTLPFHLGVGVDRVDGVQICSFGTHRDGLPPWVGAKSYRACLHLPELPMLKGEFSLYVFLLDEAGLHVYDQKVLPSAFSIETQEYNFGLFQVDHRWDSPGAALPELNAAVPHGDNSPFPATE